MQLCPPRERLEDFLAEKLADKEAALVESHVEQCKACQHILHDLTGSMGETID